LDEADVVEDVDSSVPVIAGVKGRVSTLLCLMWLQTFKAWRSTNLSAF